MLHEASPAGWRIKLDTAGLAPGEHSLTAFAWASEKGEGSYLEKRKLTVRAAPAAGEDLDEGFRTAAARLREHQQGPGYWLTAYTSAARFQEPRPEMNTYLTALLVDLLDPLAATGGLGDSLQRARRHLTAQIEAGGLVRYHGLPDAPGIGTLGCAITPDTDDTALVWRLAPDPDRRRLPAALATLDQYRTPEGLYRTWLAPREAYQCLDPGGDPNPADIAIQMHVLLLLAEVRPPAGRALCEALRPVVDQDRVWVYYRMAPLVPILRLTDLRRAGCALELPESRMRTPVPGQEIWVSAVRLLGRAPADAGGDPGSAAPARQGRLRPFAKKSAAPLPQRSHRDGLSILLVGGRRLRALAKACCINMRTSGNPIRTAKTSTARLEPPVTDRTPPPRPAPGSRPPCRRPPRPEAASASAFAATCPACARKRSSFSRARLCSAPPSRSATRRRRTSGPLAILIAANVCLVAHIFMLNDWSGLTTDLTDPNKTAGVFTARGVGRKEIGGLAAGLLVLSLLLFSRLGPSTLWLSLAIAALSALYSLPRFNWKGRPLLNSAAHLAGGALHFLLGYSLGSAIDRRGLAIATFFALTFAAGHLTQEVRDHQGDVLNAIRTNAVIFGQRRTFAASLALFTLAHALLLLLALQGILPHPWQPSSSSTPFTCAGRSRLWPRASPTRASAACRRVTARSTPSSAWPWWRPCGLTESPEVRLRGVGVSLGFQPPSYTDLPRWLVRPALRILTPWPPLHEVERGK